MVARNHTASPATARAKISFDPSSESVANTSRACLARVSRSAASSGSASSTAAEINRKNRPQGNIRSRPDQVSSSSAHASADNRRVNAAILRPARPAPDRR